VKTGKAEGGITAIFSFNPTDLIICALGGPGSAPGGAFSTPEASVVRSPIRR